MPERRRIHNNTVVDLLAIAEEMLNGELEYRRGNFDAAFTHLRRSVALDDALPYDEPWGWMQPARHALRALLLERGHFKKRRRSTAPISASTARSTGRASIPTMSGACTGSTNA